MTRDGLWVCCILIVPASNQNRKGWLQIPWPPGPCLSTGLIQFLEIITGAECMRVDFVKSGTAPFRYIGNEGLTMVKRQRGLVFFFLRRKVEDGWYVNKASEKVDWVAELEVTMIFSICWIWGDSRIWKWGEMLWSGASISGHVDLRGICVEVTVEDFLWNPRIFAIDIAPFQRSSTIGKSKRTTHFKC